MKKYILELPTAVKWIFGINITVYILCLLIFEFFGVKLQNYLGLYPFYSEHFNPIQFFTCAFTHLMSFNHLFFNMLFFLIFAPFVEKKIGSKLFLITYLFCNFIGNLFIINNYYDIKFEVEKSAKNVGIKIEDIKINDFLIEEEYIKTLSIKQIEVVDKYNYVISRTYGASSALFGIILIYLIYNILNFKKIIFNFLAIISVYNVILGYINNDVYNCGSDFAHIGGMVGGLFILIIIKIKRVL